MCPAPSRLTRARGPGAASNTRRLSRSGTTSSAGLATTGTGARGWSIPGCSSTHATAARASASSPASLVRPGVAAVPAVVDQTVVDLRIHMTEVGAGVKARLAAYGMKWGYNAQLDKLDTLLSSLRKEA